MATIDLSAQASTVKTNLHRSDVDDELRQFYARMTLDIATFATNPHLAPRQDEAAQSLWEALTASVAARAASWRRFYLQLSRLLTDAGADLASPDARGASTEALGRLKQFLRENSDIVDGAIFQGFESATARGAAPG